jgi:hypothetical protein
MLGEPIHPSFAHMTHYALTLQVHGPLNFQIGLRSGTSNPAEHSRLILCP